MTIWRPPTPFARMLTQQATQLFLQSLEMVYALFNSRNGPNVYKDVKIVLEILTQNILQQLLSCLLFFFLIS